MSIPNIAAIGRNSGRAALRTPRRGPISSTGDPPTGEGWAPVPSSPDETREHIAVAVLRGRRRRRRRPRQLLRGRGRRGNAGNRRGPLHRGLGRGWGRLLRGLGGLLRGLGGLLAGLGGTGLDRGWLDGTGLGGSRLGLRGGGLRRARQAGPP